MAIREKKYKCGKYLEVELYHISKIEQKKSRKRKKEKVEKNKKILMLRMLEKSYEDY